MTTATATTPAGATTAPGRPAAPTPLARDRAPASGAQIDEEH